MNYYEHHLGDYIRDTAHLNMTEDCVYRRLLDSYYIREKPLPVDTKECCKLVRALTKGERDAVAYILKEFFILAEDGYHQARADAEIARFKDKQAKAKNSADARWNKHKTHIESNANALQTHMRTHNERNAHQTPDTSNHINTKDTHLDIETVLPSKTAAVCVALRSEGMTPSPSHPKLQALVDDGAEVQEFIDAARMAKDRGKGFAYALGIVESTRQEAKQAAQNASAGVGHSKAKTLDWWATEQSMLAKGKEYGLSPRPGEAWPQFKGRVFDAINQKIEARE